MSLPSILLALLFCLLLVAAAIDYRRMTIPDIVTAAIALLSLPYWHATGANPFLALEAGVFAGSIGYGLRWFFQHRLGRPALGRGDVKLMAALGLWVGIDGLSRFFIAAGLAGLVTAMIWQWLKRGPLFPFAPALSAGGCFTLLT